jgi:hypothetical protein
MSRARLTFQALIVLGLIVLVSWPEQRHLRAISVWRAKSHGQAAGTRSGALPERRRTYTVGYGSYGSSAGAGANLQRKLDENDIERRRHFVTPDAVLALGGRFNGVVGYVRTSMNAPLGFAHLVLRDIATGLVEARATADEKGRFTFLDVLPSGYVVELLGPDGSVLAVSEQLPVALGDVRQTLMRTPTDLGAFRVLGSTAQAPVAAAEADGVTRVAQPDRTVSPQR